MKKIVTEFKDFISRGNVMDMAVGVIVGGAFGKITSSLVNDVFMPFLGCVIGDIDLTALNITLSPAVMEGDTVVKEEVVPGDPTRRTVIRKPEIYNAVRTIEKELNRQVRKDLLPQDKAEQEFTGVLKVALAAIDSDTESFETALQENKKDVSHLLGVFRRVSLKSIY